MNSFLIVKFVIILICGIILADNSECDLNATDMQNRSVSYNEVCSGDHPCIFKCCRENEVIHLKKRVRTCKHIDVVRKELNNDLSNISKFSNLDVYDSDIYRGEKVLKSHKNFTLLHSSMFMKKLCSLPGMTEPKLLENGNAVILRPHDYEYWKAFEPHKFCVEVEVASKNKGKVILSEIVFKFKIEEDSPDDGQKYLFVAIAMTISSLFLLAVIIVYGLLHQLRNIQGLLLMAYVTTLMCSYTLKASQIFYLYFKQSTEQEAAIKTITQIFYFTCLASFFWLKLMSFDIWWTFRGLRKLREIHRRGIRVKFAIYALYAYGASAAMTLAAVVIDTREDLPYYVAKPQFDYYLSRDTIFVYLYVPLMILTGTNCLLFVMTVYNIWLIHRAMNDFNNTAAKKNKKNQNRFWVYMKLSSLMGVGWLLELAQTRVPDELVPAWLFMLINSYTMLTGVLIFFMFVFKRSILIRLCERFKIENRFTRLYKLNSSTRSEFSKSGRGYSRTKSTTDSDVEGRSDHEKQNHFVQPKIVSENVQSTPAFELEDRRPRLNL